MIKTQIVLQHGDFAVLSNGEHWLQNWFSSLKSMHLEQNAWNLSLNYSSFPSNIDVFTNKGSLLIGTFGKVNREFSNISNSNISDQMRTMASIFFKKGNNFKNFQQLVRIWQLYSWHSTHLTTNRPQKLWVFFCEILSKPQIYFCEIKF